MVRLTNLVPRHFGIGNLFFQRFDHERGRDQVEPMKELFLDRQQDPVVIEMLNDAVAEWLRTGLFARIDKARTQKKYKGPLCAGQRFIAPDGERYFVMAIGRKMGREPERSLAVCIGFTESAANEKVVGFLHDPTIGSTPLQARPVIAEREARSERIRLAMDALVRDELAKA